jgi:hypothetical protein
VVDLSVGLTGLKALASGALSTSIGARVGQTVVLGGMHLATVPGQIILTVRPELVAE